MLERIFFGYEKAHGRYETTSLGDRGKMEGRALTVAGPVTEKEWVAHISGRGPGLGLIPLLESNMVRFGVIDVDTYPLDLDEVERRVGPRPLIICRSKSGGAHLYLFLAEPVKASLVVDKLAEWAAEMGYGGSEIFPKQTERLGDRDIGNWINIPYFNAAETERYAYKAGRRLSLDEFVAYVEQHWARELQLFIPTGRPRNDSRDEVEDSALLPEAPPCLVHLGNTGGFPSGTRNEGMFNIGVYLRKRYGEDWEPYFGQYNQEFCDPPLTPQELIVIAKSVNKKAYQYRCSNPPIKPHCNRRLCYQRRWGVGETDNAGMIEIGSIVKYEGDPTLWRIELNGKAVLIETEILYSQGSFNKLCMEQMNRVPSQMPAPRWLRYLDQKIKEASIVVSPEDASHDGQFYLLYENFCYGRVVAKRRDELANDKPWVNNGVAYFRSRALVKFLEDQRYRFTSEHHLWHLLGKLNVQKQDEVIRGKPITLWVADAPIRAEELAREHVRERLEDF